jgi:hypothetical protein
MDFAADLQQLLSEATQSGSFISSMNYSVGQIAISILFTFAFALFIHSIYKRSYNGVVYSRNFGLTLIVVSLVAAVIVMAISGNLALSLGMIGALSIVRFRSAIKDPRDIAFLFWAITNGIVAGVFIYKLAIISNLLIGLVIIFYSRKTSVKQSFLLVITGTSIAHQQIEHILEKYCSRNNLRLHTAHKDSEELHIEVRLKEKKKILSSINDLVQALHKEVRGITKVTSVSQEENMI